MPGKRLGSFVKLIYVKAVCVRLNESARMKPFRRPHFLSVLVALALLLGGAARGMAEGAGAARALMSEMVICAEDGAVSVLIDSKGNVTPVDDCDLTFCPNCLQAGAAGLVPVVYKFPPGPSYGRASVPVRAEMPTPQRVGPAQARAPPMQKA